MERFGWTQQELDEQDMARLMPAVYGTQLHAALKRVLAFVESRGRAQPAQSDWEIWTWAHEVRDEFKAPDAPTS